MSRKVVITGASSEIGLAIAEKFSHSDFKLLLQGYNNLDMCEKLSKKLGDRCILLQCDFSTDLGTDELIQNMHETDILINGAALNTYGLLANYPDDSLNKMIKINIESLVKITRAAINEMLPKRKGCIVNISSVMAQRGLRGGSLYSGTKGFMESMSRSIAAEYGKKGIRINNVAPGPIDSGALKKTREYAEDVVQKLSISKRLGTPEDVANLVYFLTTDEAEFINGKTYAIDGGFNTGV